jgi:hypothetical protein
MPTQEEHCLPKLISQVLVDLQRPAPGCGSRSRFEGAQGASGA